MQTLTQNRSVVKPSPRLPNQAAINRGLHSEALIRDRVLTELITKLQDRHFDIEKRKEPGGGIVHLAYYAPRRLASILEKEGRSDVMFDRTIVAIPGPILNAIVCQQLSEKFGDEAMEGTGCFRKEIVEGHDEVCWRLDVDSWLSRQGFMLPIYRNGLISDLKVYRRPSDERPFILQARQEVALNV